MFASSAVRGTCMPSTSTTMSSYETCTDGGVSTGVHWKNGWVETTTSRSCGMSNCGGSGCRIENSAQSSVTGVVEVPTKTRAQA